MTCQLLVPVFQSSVVVEEDVAESDSDSERCSKKRRRFDLSPSHFLFPEDLMWDNLRALLGLTLQPASWGHSSAPAVPAAPNDVFVKLGVTSKMCSAFVNWRRMLALGTYKYPRVRDNPRDLDKFMVLSGAPAEMYEEYQLGTLRADMTHCIAYGVSSLGNCIYTQRDDDIRFFKEWVEDNRNVAQREDPNCINLSSGDQRWVIKWSETDEINALRGRIKAKWLAKYPTQQALALEIMAELMWIPIYNVALI